MNDKPILKEEESGGLVPDATKLMWHQERVKAWLAGERAAPITITVSESILVM
jgi:hypothetical protein